MMTRDPLIGEAFDRLPIPEHAPGFTDELMARIDEVEHQRLAAVTPIFDTAAGSDEDSDDASGAQIVELQPSIDRRAGRSPISRKVLAGVASVAAVALVAIGLSTLRDESAPDTSIAATGPTQPPNSVVTEPPTTAGPVAAEDLALAQTAVETFVDSLGRGELAAAAAVVGPVSEAQTEANGGLESWLQQSTEGHGAWIGSTDRVVTPVGFDLGLVVVVIEGTVQVEGSTEHRTIAYPVRKAESAGVWFVEPFAYDVGSVPLQVTEAVRDASASEVRVSVIAEGTAYVSFDTAAPTKQPVSPSAPVAFTEGPGQQVATVLYAADGTLYATTADLADTTGATPGAIAVPFLDDATNSLLSQCASGEDSACDAAQEPGVLDDGAFSYFHEQCDQMGVAAYCNLFDNLVAAELRMHNGE